MSRTVAAPYPRSAKTSAAASRIAVRLACLVASRRPDTAGIVSASSRGDGGVMLFREGDDLLEGGAIGPAHRVLQKAGLEDDALLPGVRAPDGGGGTLRLGEPVDRAGDRRPQRCAAGREVAATAVAHVERPLDRLAGDAPRVLLRVPLPPHAVPRRAALIPGQAVARLDCAETVDEVAQ